MEATIPTLFPSHLDPDTREAIYLQTLLERPPSQGLYGAVPGQDPVPIFAKSSKDGENEVTALGLARAVLGDLVPQVYDSVPASSGTASLLVTSVLPGKTLDSIEAQLTDADVRAIASDLREAILKLRSRIPAPSGAICSVMGREVLDFLLRPYDNPPWVGPFETIEDFHAFVRRPFFAGGRDRVRFEEVAETHGRQYDIMFTHNDLSPFNILIDDTRSPMRLSGIVDWECAGFFPTYWEYVQSMAYGPRPMIDKIWENVYQGAFDVELKVHRYIRSQGDG